MSIVRTAGSGGLVAYAPVRARVRTRTSRRRVWAVVGVVSSPFLFLGLLLIVFAAGGMEPEQAAPTPVAVADIPADFLALYQEAGAAYGIDWAVVAGIGKLECDHGRVQLAGCNPTGTINRAGARGPMQFLGSTWRRGAGQFQLDVAGPAIAAGQESQGYATDGNGNGIADPWETADAIHAAARYLRSNGAPEDYASAIWAYNHSDVYRSEVFRWADTYRTAAEAAEAAEAADGGTPVPGPVPLSEVRGITVNASIAGQLDAMIGAAAADGVVLSGSGYRSADEQIALRRAHCGTSNYAIYEMPSSQCSPPTARPGTSMHEQGLAVDFDNCSSRSTACWQWLDANAATHGFFNLPSEPWHWSVDGS